MFKNTNIKIEGSRNNCYSLTTVYEDIEAQKYVSSSPLTWKIIPWISEDSHFNLVYFLVDISLVKLRIWQIVSMINHFGVTEKYKILNLEVTPMFSVDSFIQIKCEELDSQD